MYRYGVKRVQHRTGRSEDMGGAVAAVGHTEISELINDAQTALGWSDLKLARRAKIHVKMLRYFKREQYGRPPGEWQTSGRVRWNTYQREALASIVNALEGGT